MKIEPDKLDVLAKFLDGFDDGLAAEARQMASDMRNGLVTIALDIVELSDGDRPDRSAASLRHH